MRLHGPEGAREPIGDLLVGFALDEVLEDRALARSQTPSGPSGRQGVA